MERKDYFYKGYGIKIEYLVTGRTAIGPVTEVTAVVISKGNNIIETLQYDGNGPTLEMAYGDALTTISESSI